jgi:two-component system response regulator BaeR
MVMTQPLIVIVEDEIKLASLLSDYLQQANYSTQIIDRGDIVIDWVKDNKPSLVILDVMLPGVDGLTLCKEIRRFSNVPIFMVTARVDEIDRLLGLELGADDYICKPFSPREVVARVKSLFRRLQPSGESIPTDIVTLDAHRQQVRVHGNVCDLTSVEFQLLSTMAKEPGRIYSRDQLMDNMYNDNRIVSDRTIDSHIKKLRKRLNDYFPEYEFIHSVYGAGYRYDFVEKNSK